MAKNITTTEIKPTAAQKTILRLTTRPEGATRKELIKALGMSNVEYKIPVQTMVKTVAERFDHTLTTEYLDKEAKAHPTGKGPAVAVYGLRPKAERRAATATKRSPRKVAR